MQTDPLLVSDLRALFKAGATPSTLIRCIADRHPGEPEIDRLVRAYFREAFFVPMLRVGRESVAEIAQGIGSPSLNGIAVHRMVATRSEWDKPTPDDGTPQPCWLDSLTATDESQLLKKVEAGTLPELAGSWDRIDEPGRRFIARAIASAQALYEKVQILAALAERLQQQIHASEGLEARDR